MSTFVVMKFGGSSQCLQGTKVIFEKITEYTKQNKKVILVISAVGKTTNDLYSITNNNFDRYDNIYNVHKSYCESINVDFKLIEPFLEELKKDMNDYKYKHFLDTVQLKLKIISWGEILASNIVYQFLVSEGLYAEYLNAHKFIKNTNSSYNIDSDTLNLKGDFYCDKKNLIELLSSNFNVYVTQGFVGTTQDNKLCVLTRSGSNTSASLIANSVNAIKLEIFTDVSGLFTADPRIITSAKQIPIIRYDLCQEAAAMGSQIIHPFSIKPCKEKNIPIHIRNTFEPESTGTIINGFTKTTESDIVHLISIQNNVTIFKVSSLDMSEGYGFVFDIFSVFNDEKIDVNIVTTSQFEISTTTNEKNKTKLNRTLQRLSEKYQVILIEKCSIVSIIADSVIHNKKMQDIHKLIYSNGIKTNMIHYSSNGLTLSYVIPNDYATSLANILHKKLIEIN